LQGSGIKIQTVEKQAEIKTNFTAKVEVTAQKIWAAPFENNPSKNQALS